MDAIIVIDNGLNVSFWNPAAQRLFGYTHDQIIGKPISCLLTQENLSTVPMMKQFIENQPTNEPTNYLKQRD